jgi:histidinol-phosphatase (PHP family)
MAERALRVNPYPDRHPSRMVRTVCIAEGFLPFSAHPVFRMPPLSANHATSPAATLPGDSHTHTFRCRHAGGEVVEYARAARDAGLPFLAATDHIPHPGGGTDGLHMTLAELPGYAAAVLDAREKLSYPVLLGLEAEFELARDREWLSTLLARHPFDLVLGSVHCGDHWRLTPASPEATPQKIRAIWVEYAGHVAELARSGAFDVVAHLDLAKRTGLIPPPDLLEETMFPALDAIAEAGEALEINTSGLVHPAGEPYPSLPLLRRARALGIPICFGSDAHAPEDVAQFFPAALALARAAGYSTYAVFSRRVRREVPLPPP